MRSLVARQRLIRTATLAASVLLIAACGAVRPRPACAGPQCRKAGKRADGPPYIQAVPANGTGAGQAAEEPYHETGDGTGYVDAAPSSSTHDGQGMHYAFQHVEPGGS